MNCYCPRGHRISYAAVKPETCPSCGTAMAIKVVVQPPAPTAFTAASGLPQPYQVAQPLKMTVRASRVQSQSIKIGDLQSSGIAVERSTARRGGLRDAAGHEIETVTPESLVENMLKGGGQE